MAAERRSWRVYEQDPGLVRDPEQLRADAPLVAQRRGCKRRGIVILRIEVCGNDAFQGEVAGEQDRVRFEARGALGNETVEHLTGREQFTAEGALGIPAHDELRESKRCEQHGQHECREREEDLGPQTTAFPESYWSHLEPRIAGRERSSASERWNVSSMSLAASCTRWAVSATFSRLCGCHATSE